MFPESIWAAQPSTTRGIAIHLSYDKKSDRIAYASGRSVFLRSVSKPEECVQYVNHTAATTVAKFAPSGFYVASGDEDGFVKVWDAVGEDMVTKGEYQVISGRINDLEWDIDSQRIIAVGDGKERYGHCFTADSGNSVGEISGHTEIVNAVSIRPVRPYRAATVSDDNNMVFYQGPPFRFNFTSRGNHGNFINDVRFSPDGNYIVTVGADKGINLYDGKTGEFSSKVECDHGGGIFAVAWSPDSSKFVTSSADGSVKLWDATEKKLLQTWTLEKTLEHQQVGVVFAGEERIVSLSYNGDLNYFIIGSNEIEKTVKGHQKNITALASTENNLYSGSYDGALLQWKNSVGSPIEGEGHSSVVSGLATTNGKVWSVGWDNTLKCICGEKFCKSVKLEAQPKGIQSSAEGSAVAVVSDDYVELFKDGEKIQSKMFDFSPTAIGVSDELIALGTPDNQILLFTHDLATSAGSMPPLRASATYLAFSPNGGDLLAAGDSAGKITLYKTSDKSVQTTRWAFHNSRITSIDWHESGEYVVSGSVDTNIIVYSVKTPAKNIKLMGGHVDGVNSVVWSGKDTIVSAGADAAIKHWKVTFHQ